MIWLILWIIWTLFWEIKSSISKKKSKKHHFLKVWTISSFFWMLVFLIILIYKYYFTDLTLYINPESIPLLFIRLVFEILQSYFTVLAIKKCDRSTFSIMRILTIPLLIIADIILWYQFTNYSLIWILIILLSFFAFNLKSKTINFKWIQYVLFTAINAVFTISIFKYSISHYWNSVEIDQFFINLWVLIFFFTYNYKINKDFAIGLILKEKQFILQWLVIWISSLLISYSYLYLNASEAVTVKRWGEMLWAIFAWTIFFQEDGIVKKLIFATFIMIGLWIMII